MSYPDTPWESCDAHLIEGRCYVCKKLGVLQLLSYIPPRFVCGRECWEQQEAIDRLVTRTRILYRDGRYVVPSSDFWKGLVGT